MSEITREKNQQRLLEYLVGKSCKDCGIEDLRVLTFDHRNRKTKSMTVSSCIHKGLSWSLVMKEINKCDLICAACHVRRECIRDRSRRQIFWEQLQKERKNES